MNDSSVVLNSSSFGLTSEEAGSLLTKFGKNEILDNSRSSLLQILLRQVKKNFIIYLLFVSVIISFIVGKDLTAYVISAVIFLVITVGFIQEYRAEKAISSLKKMLMPTSIVIRSGKEMEVPTEFLVPGDLVILGSGERIPADCLLVSGVEVRVDESTLTGEAKEVKKKSYEAGEYLEENLLLMGTFLVSGRARVKVLHTGMNTRFGKIASLITTAEKELPLQDKINKISKYMSVIAIVIAILTGALMMARAESLNIEVLINILILVIALAVSAFPEGFPVVLITSLATGAANMAKQNAIVNRMSIIETLGETTVICCDKTGTLTRGEMTVKKVFLGDNFLEVSGSGFEGKGQFLFKNEIVDPLKNYDLNLLLQSAVLCNDSRIERTGEDMEYKIIGTPTEGALKVLGAKAEIFSENLGERISEMPFSSARKMMSVLIKSNKGFQIFAKGAPEVILEKCTFCLRNGKVIKLSSEEKKQILLATSSLTQQAYRSLAIAFKEEANERREYREDGLIFLGLLGLEDPPREEVAEALLLCESAGIKVKMITGDHKETAVSIGQQIGLTGKVIEGEEIDKLTDEEFSAILPRVVIFARVRPEHKLRIVKLLKNLGEIVTMTGDGVNDAPALKEAHIGVAMGKNGTDVSRSVADLTLKDDNFATIVLAIKEGRGIFNNIRKFVSYQLSCNFAELFILFIGVLLAPFFGWPVPLLLALHILFMNLVTDELPAITLGFNPTSPDIMREKPRQKADILNKPLMVLIWFNGLLMGISTLAVYFVSFNLLGQTIEIARTQALVTLIIVEIVSAFNFRSFRNKVFNRSLLVNKYLFVASIISILATLIILYTKANIAFETVALKPLDWIIVIIPALLLVIIYDILKEYSFRTKTLLHEIH
ncbi:MAG: cation-transporting P-type ATPase [Candidatus Daviesbacteria bacterium]|nr:cation-transporting P-type ATPase [Candidatus Daviesbacteria bacterium]